MSPEESSKAGVTAEGNGAGRGPILGRTSQKPSLEGYLEQRPSGNMGVGTEGVRERAFQTLVRLKAQARGGCLA